MIAKSTLCDGEFYYAMQPASNYYLRQADGINWNTHSVAAIDLYFCGPFIFIASCPVMTVAVGFAALAYYPIDVVCVSPFNVLLSSPFHR